MKTTRTNNFIAAELKKVTIYLKPAPLTAQDQRKLNEGKAATAVAAQ